ncbi:MAG: acyltransferase [Pseudolysinimonas sp.]
MTDRPPFVQSTADVADSAQIGPGSKVWHYAQIREDAQIGADSIIGRGAYIGSGVIMGDGCKVQNYALVYEPARLGAGVFIGPAVVLTNDHFPRAINPDGTPKSASDWQPVGVTIQHGASIGASATCVAPVTIGRWALVGAGSVVISDVPDFALVVGSPARRVGWVGKAGSPLVRESDGIWRCPLSGDGYIESDGELKEATP